MSFEMQESKQIAVGSKHDQNLDFFSFLETFDILVRMSFESTLSPHSEYNLNQYNPKTVKCKSSVSSLCLKS